MRDFKLKIGDSVSEVLNEYFKEVKEEFLEIGRTTSFLDDRIDGMEKDAAVTQLTRIADSLEVIAKSTEPRVTHVQAKTSFTQEEMQRIRKRNQRATGGN